MDRIGIQLQNVMKDGFRYPLNWVQSRIKWRLKQKTKAIGVIIPEISNNLFSEVIGGIEDEAFMRDYQVLILQTHESLEREIKTVSQMYDRRVDGLLISLSII